MECPQCYGGDHGIASMGPRPFGRGMVPAGRGRGNAARRFNGAATFRSRNAPDSPPSQGLGRQASMGPRPFGRGMAVGPAGRCGGGAASMGPRPFGRGMAEAAPMITATVAALQWGRDLSVAECRRPRPPCPHRRRFNGAATFRSRNARAGPGAGARAGASMGPRPFGRGMWPPALASILMLLLQWGRDLSVAECTGSRWRMLRMASFNGAATFRSRNVRVDVGSRVAQPASMGPRPFGRGMKSLRRGPRGVDGFNGAATFRSRNAHKYSHASTLHRASMGPRPFGRGMCVLPI